VARPDGLCVVGNWLVFAMFEGGHLMAIHQTTGEIKTIPLPIYYPTKIAFGGNQNQWIFLTSANRPHPNGNKQASSLNGKVLMCDSASLVASLDYS